MQFSKEISKANKYHCLVRQYGLFSCHMIDFHNKSSHNRLKNRKQSCSKKFLLKDEAAYDRKVEHPDSLL